MSYDSDLLVDRRRLKRSLVLWRAAAIVAVVAVVIVATGRVLDFTGEDYVARLTVDGVIVSDPERIDAIIGVAEDDEARALLVWIDSPGGTFVGGESLFRALRTVADRKPVVAVMGTLATSAGYMVAIAADHVIAHEGTITGSIGVILQTADVTGLLEKLGISVEAIKSSPLKATPSPLEPMTDEMRAAAQVLIDDMHERFQEMVVERRGLDGERVAWLADGRVYSGRRAVEHALIDAIGDEAAARSWLVETRGVAGGLPIHDIVIERPDDSLFASIRSLSENMVFSERLTLDGLISLWQPDGG
jgi:protease-4